MYNIQYVIISHSIFHCCTYLFIHGHLWRDLNESSIFQSIESFLAFICVWCVSISDVCTKSVRRFRLMI